MCIRDRLSASFGNSTFAFLMFTFLCTYALSQTPFVRRCAVWFVSSRMAQKGPWQLTWLFFLSVIFLGLFISPTVLFVIYLPIIEEIYAVLGIQKGDKAASMLMMGLVLSLIHISSTTCVTLVSCLRMPLLPHWIRSRTVLTVPSTLYPAYVLNWVQCRTVWSTPSTTWM